MSPGSSTESYPAFARIGLRENPGKNLNQITCPDRDSNPGHLVSRPDALTVTPQEFIVANTEVHKVTYIIRKTYIDRMHMIVRRRLQPGSDDVKIFHLFQHDSLRSWDAFRIGNSHPYYVLKLCLISVKDVLGYPQHESNLNFGQGHQLTHGIERAFDLLILHYLFIQPTQNLSVLIAIGAYAHVVQNTRVIRSYPTYNFMVAYDFRIVRKKPDVLDYFTAADWNFLSTYYEMKAYYIKTSLKIQDEMALGRTRGTIATYQMGTHGDTVGSKNWLEKPWTTENQMGGRVQVAARRTVDQNRMTKNTVEGRSQPTLNGSNNQC
ncbi:hypothetical protein ANN_05055 [Periplaneta americana]|uniref:Uncharacterized protein n=1 Tax=Periplaneta americana TaxID=6978 RepID=A0ABQ8TC59_PERAM|nr:hypothetical protein ANN_05055 [Periplaneta americana]